MNYFISLTIKRVFFFCLFLQLNSLVYSQCTTNSTTGTCTGGSGKLVNNTTVGSGVKYWWDAGTSTITGFKIQSGGTLVVCGGHLTLGNVDQFEGGTIIVNSGAQLTITSSKEFKSDFTLVNYGTLTFSSNMTFQDNSLFFNQTGSTANFGNDLFIKNSATINNRGAILIGHAFHAGDVNTGTRVCQGNGAYMQMPDKFTATNSFTNTIRTPTGTSCIGLGNTLEGDVAMTPDAGLKLCLKPGTSYNPATTPGSANVTTGCSGGCASLILPIELSYFDVFLISNKTALLDWETATETNNDYFTIEKSYDAESFFAIGTMNGAGNSHAALNYKFTDNNSSESKEIVYYRIKQTDFDGQFDYTPIRAINLNETTYNRESSNRESSIGNSQDIYPNPTSSIVNLPSELEFEVFNVLGNSMLTGLGSKVDLTSLSSGIYIIKTPQEVYKIVRE